MSEDFKIDLDEKAIAKEAPIFVRGQVEKLIREAEERINSADGIFGPKDGKADIGQLADVVQKGLPLLLILNEAIDFEKAAEQAAQLPFIKDHEKFAAALKQLGSLAEHVGSKFPQIGK